MYFEGKLLTIIYELNDINPAGVNFINTIIMISKEKLIFLFAHFYIEVKVQSQLQNKAARD